MIRCAIVAAIAAGALASAAVASAAPTPAAATLTAHAGRLVLAANSEVRGSAALIGAEFVVPADGKLIGVRLDSIDTAPERPGVLLHHFTIAATDATGTQIRAPLCSPDRAGRNAAVPVAGTLDASGHHHPDPKRFFLACTSGAVGKCLLWGYAPWSHAPDGTSLELAYQACLHMVRADYAGDNTPHTKNGTPIDTADIYGIETFDSTSETGASQGTFAFEAGWSPNGAVCVARTRWPELADYAALIAKHPDLGGPCDRAAATKRGALLFTRVIER